MGRENFGTEFVVCNAWLAETRREETAVSQEQRGRQSSVIPS